MTAAYSENRRNNSDSGNNKHYSAARIEEWVKKSSSPSRFGFYDQESGLSNTGPKVKVSSKESIFVKPRLANSDDISNDWVLAENPKWQEGMLLGIGGWANTKAGKRT